MDEFIRLQDSGRRANEQGENEKALRYYHQALNLIQKFLKYSRDENQSVACRMLMAPLYQNMSNAFKCDEQPTKAIKYARLSLSTYEKFLVRIVWIFEMLRETIPLFEDLYSMLSLFERG